jgi:hypothetical protein
MLGIYLYFKYFSVRGELKRIHKSMLNNSDIKTRNSELYIILYIKVQRSHMIYYTIQRPNAEEKLIVYSSLLVAIVYKHNPTAHIY